MKKIVLICLSMIALVSCSSQETFTTDYLIENPDKLDEILEQCKVNKQSSENCENANHARSIIFSKTGDKEVHQWQ